MSEAQAIDRVCLEEVGLLDGGITDGWIRVVVFLMSTENKEPTPVLGNC